MKKKPAPHPSVCHGRLRLGGCNIAAAARQRPPQAGVARLRFRKIPPGIYENAETGKVIVIAPPQRAGTDSEYYLGHIRIRNSKYKYASWRQGKKIKEKYLGAIEKQN